MPDQLKSALKHYSFNQNVEDDINGGPLRVSETHYNKYHCGQGISYVCDRFKAAILRLFTLEILFYIH